MTAPLPVATLPDVTTAQMREIDRVMIEDLGISLVQMMENAGRSLADLAMLVAPSTSPSSCVVLAGPGGNGGGGLVAARHLANRGIDVEVVLAAPDRLAEVPRRQLGILERMGVPIVEEPGEAELVIDAVIGYGVEGDPRGRAGELIAWANARHGFVLSLDGPSGLDLTTGRIGQPCVLADATMTLAAPKRGLRLAPGVVGTLYAADISVPPGVFVDLELRIEPFAHGPIVRVR